MSGISISDLGVRKVINASATLTRLGGSLMPPEFKTQRPLDPAGADVRAAPSDKAKVLKHVDADGRLFVFQERDGWYQVFVRGESRAIGWVRKDQVTTTNDPPPAPPPATDS